VGFESRSTAARGGVEEIFSRKLSVTKSHPLRKETKTLGASVEDLLK